MLIRSQVWFLTQELEQSRPAEEIWLDALITVLEEACTRACKTAESESQGCFYVEVDDTE